MATNRSKSIAKTALKRAGFELQRSDPEGSYPKRRQLLLERERIDTVLDVGAHAGEFGQSLRHSGYSGRIVSFEPVAALHRRLCDVAAADPAWSCRKIAVGERSGEVEINVSGNDGFSSSIREMEAAHTEAAPSSTYVGSETVELSTLDLLKDDALEPASRALLKVDTQGYESEVLAGATETLSRCPLVELELGLVELYSGQALFAELVAWMEERGLLLTDLEPGFRDEGTGKLLQVDALFLRRTAPDAG